MTDSTQPEALRDARWYMVNKDGMATRCTDRADAEKEAEDAQSVWPHMGPHRAVQLVEVADVEALRTGYAAARMEIESLQARIKTVAEERSDELTVAHLDGRMRAAQPAGAQQPGAAYAELPDADRDYMRKVVAVAVTMLFDGYKGDVTRVFSPGELSEFVTITAAMGWERVEDIYRRAWDLLSLPVRASHGQAPAQAAPQQEVQEPVMIYHGDCTIDCGEHGHHHVELLRMIPAGSKLYTAPQPSPQADSQPAPQGETNAHLDTDSNSSAPRQQRDVAGPVALGQPVGNGSDQAAGHTGAQGDKLLTVAERNIRSFLRSAVFKSESDREAALNCVDVLWEAARAPADIVTAPAGGEVAYLDIGAGGYLDLGTDLSNEALSRLPKGRHALVIAGTYGIDGYTAAPNTKPAPDEILNMAREQGLPETETEGVFRVNVDDLGRMFAAARAAQEGNSHD